MNNKIDNENIEFLFIFLKSNNEIENIKSKKINIKKNIIEQNTILNEIINVKKSNIEKNKKYILYKIFLYEQNNNKIINYNSICDIELEKVTELFKDLNSYIIILKEKETNNVSKSRKIIYIKKEKKTRKK